MKDAAFRNLCVLPALGLLAVFHLVPLLASLGLSLTEFNPIIDDAPAWRGFGNYLELFAGPRREVLHAFLRSAALVAVAVGLQTLLGFGAALLLQGRYPGRGLLTAALLVPMLLSPAVMGTFWRYLFNADYGLVNWYLDGRWSWDGSQGRAFWAVVAVETWMWTPFMLLLSLAGLSRAGDRLREAAETDGASRWFRFRHVTWPLAAPLVLLGVAFRALESFRLFDTAMVLNGNLEGQPTTFVSVLLHARGFGGSRSLGEPTALACVVIAATLALGWLALRALDRART